MTMLNKKHSEETKRKISIASKGNKSFSGRKHSEETLKKMRHPRPYNLGRPAWNKGKGVYKTKEERQRARNISKYGITKNDYNEILVKQDYVCAICLKPETKKHQNGTLCSLSIDHSHLTNKVRGLLCSKCNFAIGQLDDNPYLCERAAKYLLSNK